MTKSLTDILEELIYKKCCKTIGSKKYEPYDKAIAQAKKKLEEMFGEWVGEDENSGHPSYCPDNCPGCMADARDELRQEIRNRVKSQNE